MKAQTIADLAQQALDVQDASNLSGVLNSWQENKDLIWEDCRERGVDFNTHPVNRLFASKVHHLAQMGLSDLDAYHIGYAGCHELAGG